MKTNSDQPQDPQTVDDPFDPHKALRLNHDRTCSDEWEDYYRASDYDALLRMWKSRSVSADYWKAEHIAGNAFIDKLLGSIIDCIDMAPNDDPLPHIRAYVMQWIERRMPIEQ